MSEREYNNSPAQSDLAPAEDEIRVLSRLFPETPALVTCTTLTLVPNLIRGCA